MIVTIKKYTKNGVTERKANISLEDFMEGIEEEREEETKENSCEVAQLKTALYETERKLNQTKEALRKTTELLSQYIEFEHAVSKAGLKLMDSVKGGDIDD